MPLSKAKNRDRMREARLHKRLTAPHQSKPVQPKPNLPFSGVAIRAIDGMYTKEEKLQALNHAIGGIDADGNPVYEE